MLLVQNEDEVLAISRGIILFMNLGPKKLWSKQCDLFGNGIYLGWTPKVGWVGLIKQDYKLELGLANCPHWADSLKTQVTLEKLLVKVVSIYFPF